MYIKVHVQAGSKKEVIKQTGENRYDISVREPALRNLANGRIIEIIQSMHPKALVRIVNGHHSPSKLISVNED